MRDSGCEIQDSGNEIQNIPHRVPRISHHLSRISNLESCILPSSRNHHRQPLNSPKRDEGSNRVTGQRLHPAWPADFENAKSPFQRQNQTDETKLYKFDANTETNECQWQFLTRQARAGECAGEAKAMEQAEGKCYHPGMGNREAHLTAP